MAACNSTKKTENGNQQATAVAEQPATPIITAAPTAPATLSGYFLKNNYQFSNGIDFLLLPDRPTFDSYLGVAKTMNNEIDEPNFTEHVVAAIIVRPTNKKVDISISKVEQPEEHLVNIYFEAKIGETLTYTATPLLVFELPKVTGVNTINFITNGKTVQSLRLD